MQTEKNLAYICFVLFTTTGYDPKTLLEIVDGIEVIGRLKLESEIHDKIPTYHLVFSLLVFCPLGFIPTTVTMGIPLN